MTADVRRRASTMGDGAEAPPVADAARRRKGKQQADKRAFMPSKYATIVFQGKEKEL